MCGVAGILSLQGRPVCPELLRQMTEALRHRGPDQGDTYLENSLGLGCRRLVMRHPETGRQPARHPQLPLYAVFNGEIYNSPELCQRLGIDECGEGELLCRLYLRYGNHFPRLLVGMFALAVWDGRTGQLLLARDRSGMKPLYYYQDREFLLFASELKSLLAYPQLDQRLNLRALDHYLRFMAVLDPECILSRVSKVAAGHVLICQGSQLRGQSFHRERLGPVRAGLNLEEASRDAEDRLRSSLKLCLRSHVPLGIWLSGGLDSASLAALAVELEGGAHTFSLGFERPEWDESAFSARLANQLGTRHQHLILEEAMAAPAVLQLGRSLDEPLGDSSALACSLLAAFCRTSVKGVLSGDGGDEWFGGYSWHPQSQPYQGHLEPFLEHPGWSVFSRPERQQVYRPEFLEALTRDATAAEWGLHPDYLSRCSGPEAAMHIDQRTFLRSDLLVKVDRTSMMHSLEARLPMLNHPLTDFLQTLPGELRLQGGSKALLRQLLGRRLSPEWWQRPKQGFSIPAGLWLWKPGPLRSLAYSLILDSPLLERLLRRPALEQLLQQHDELPSRGQHLWSLMMLALWGEHFYAGKIS